MSAIRGKGFGSKHNWINEGTTRQGLLENNIFTEYSCKDCKHYFRHYYKRYKNIFEAMDASSYVSDECIKEQEQ